jgi:hypothetical protein
MLQRIKRAAEDDWRAAAEWLRLTFADDYRRASETNVEVNTAVQSAAVCDEATRMKLIEQRNRLLLEAQPEARKAEVPEEGNANPSDGKSATADSTVPAGDAPAEPDALYQWWLSVGKAENEPEN